MAEQPSASPLRNAEQIFMSYRRRRAAGEELDFDAFCREHADLEEDLRFLNSVFCLGQSAGSTASFRDLLKEQFGDGSLLVTRIMSLPAHGQRPKAGLLRLISVGLSAFPEEPRIRRN